MSNADDLLRRALDHMDTLRNLLPEESAKNYDICKEIDAHLSAPPPEARDARDVALKINSAYCTTNSTVTVDDVAALIAAHARRVRSDALWEAHENLMSLSWQRSEQSKPWTWKDVVEKHEDWLDSASAAGEEDDGG
jgi:hypothetical protein